MAVGSSGRVVIEIDPGLKRELYATLSRDGVTLKDWFLKRVNEQLKDHGQLSLGLTVADGDPENRKYR